MPLTMLQGAAYFTGVQLRIDGASKAAVTKSARLVQKEARRVLGTYDYGWPPLAQSTIDTKTMGDSPGLETGAMKRSIKIEVTGHREHWEAVVGSDMPRALYFELGTISQPPRSFLEGAGRHMEHKIHEICGRDLYLNLFSHHPDHEDEWSYDGED